MHKINDRLGLMGRIMPDTYLAASLTDFLKNKGEIKTFSWDIRNTFTGIGHPGNALIVVPNIEAILQNQGEYLLRDTTSEVLSYMFEQRPALYQGRHSHILLLHAPGVELPMIFGTFSTPHSSYNPLTLRLANSFST